MPEAFGARLRDWRERRQISLGTIADQTKIKVSLLEALERDDVSHWPGGIFRRAFVRSYAKAIGLEPDAVVREFTEIYPDPEEPLSVFAASAEDPSGPLARFRAVFGLAPRREWAESPADAPVVHRTIVSEPRVDRPQPAERRPSASVQPAEPALTAGSAARAETAVPVETVAKTGPAVRIEPASPAEPAKPDLAAVAELCTALARVEEWGELAPLVSDTARVLGANGVIVWMWDPDSLVLRAVLAHGYSDEVLALLPAVDRADENATAAAFRFGRTSVVDGADRTCGALAVPLLTPFGCAGVLALELPAHAERHASLQAAAEIVAAQLAAMMRQPAAPAEADRKRA